MASPYRMCAHGRPDNREYTWRMCEKIELEIIRGPIPGLARKKIKKKNEKRELSTVKNK